MNTDALVRLFRGSYAISGIAFFGLATSYLFVSELSEFMRSIMLPSLLVYAIGAGGIGYYHALSHARKGIEEQEPRAILPESKIRTIFIAHGVWFVAFVVFNLVAGFGTRDWIK